MRLNYYKFPETVDAQTRFRNGAAAIDGGNCEFGHEDDRICDICEDGCLSCEHFIVTDAEEIIGGIKITAAKKLLKEFGGSAWTKHIDRDGGVFETTPIKLSGNNSHHKYNKHL